MRNKVVARVMAAVLTGAMVMTTPSIALADSAASYYKYYDVNTALPVVSNLAIVYEDGDPYLTWAPLTLKEEQELVLEYSTDANFTDDKTDYFYLSDETAKEGKCGLDGWRFDNGFTHYIRMAVYDWNREGTVSPYGAYSAPVEYTGKIDDPSIADVKVGKSSVTFRFSNYGVTGYEIYRKTGTGTKYTKVATIADNVYADKSLKANQTYSYKIRAYVYDKDTQKTNYSDYIYESYTTWGSALNLKARATGTRTVKLTWKKVTGATGYKIYRAVGGTRTSEWKAGDNASYGNYKLIKTIKKAKTVSYTDKKLNKDQTYTYKVVAYKNVKKNGKTSTVMNVEDIASVVLGFEGFSGVRVTEVDNADGSVSLKWNKILGAEKFVVKQYGKQADGNWDYIAIAELPATTTSYVFPAGEDNDNWDTDYRIYVYSGTEVDYRSVSTSLTKVAKTTGITAVPTADLTGVTVSWQAVPGAQYYKVYRSTRMTSYNPDTDSYGYNGSAIRILEKAGTPITDALGTYYDEWENEPVYTDKIQALSVVDTYQGYAVKESGAYNPKTQQSDPDRIVMEDVQQAPAQGIRYYYYVQAFAPNGKVLSDGTPEGFNSASQFDKPASVVLNSVELKKPSIKSVKAGKKKATVSWKKVTGASKYYVYYSTKKNKDYIFAGVTTKTKLAVTGLESGKKYYFKVKACAPNAVGADVYSSLSAAKSKKVK